MNKELMREAIRLATDMMQQGRGGPFGALVVRQGQILSRGWNQVTTTHDPTAHAEIVAIREACRRLRTFRLDDCELYASCEPCPMCLAAIYWARLGRVYYGATRKDAAHAGFDDQLIYAEVARPIGRRRLPLRQLLAREARAPLVAWQAKPDKTAY